MLPLHHTCLESKCGFYNFYQIMKLQCSFGIYIVLDLVLVDYNLIEGTFIVPTKSSQSFSGKNLTQ